MPRTDAITRERLRSVLNYNPETGIFTWLARPVRPASERTDKAWNSRYARTPAGTLKDGYVNVTIDAIIYRAHRIAFLWMEGWVPDEVDHCDLDRSNNRWINLRPATRSQNFGNKRARSDNTSGVKGVHRCAGKWRAGITVRGQHHSLGMFDDMGEAAAAYKAAAEKHYGEFARTS